MHSDSTDIPHGVIDFVDCG